MSLEPASARAQEWECRVSVECQRVKEETDGQQERGVHVKEDPEWKRDPDWSLDRDVKEESGLLALYAGHKVEGDLVLGPEGPQLPDSAFVQPRFAPSPSEDRGRGEQYHCQRRTPVNQLPASPPLDKQLRVRPGGPPTPARSSVTPQKRKHNSKKPVSCDVYMKRFTQKNSLVAHTRIHTGEKPYSCDLCEKRFGEKQNLNVHRRTHTGKKPYSCDVCMKQFTQKNSLVAHRRIHTGEKPYSCDLCEKRFGEKRNLNVHRRTHTGKKPYSCDVCMKQFTQKKQFSRA